MAAPLRRQPPQAAGGVSRSIVDGLSDAAVGLFRNLEGALIGRMAQMLRQPVAIDRWVSTKLSLLQRLRMWVEKLLTGVDSDLPAVIEQAVTQAWQRGATAATAGIGHLFPQPIGPPTPDPATVARLTTDTVARIRATEPQIFQWAMSSYREVVNAHAGAVLDGSRTRLQASQAAWTELTGKGITGFVDKAGRNWELSTYVEMAMRTATAHAAVEGQLARLEELGVDLVMVSDSPQECFKCRPWEGQVLARKGLPGARTVDVEHGIHDGVMVPVHIAGTVSEAVGSGLLHPNCRHSISAFLPGVTKPHKNTEDTTGDKARQRLREIERNVRAWKRRETGALNDIDKAAAARKVASWQAVAREHVNATGLHRQPQREQTGAGNIPAHPTRRLF